MPSARGQIQYWSFSRSRIVIASLARSLYFAVHIVPVVPFCFSASPSFFLIVALPVRRSVARRVVLPRFDASMHMHETCPASVHTDSSSHYFAQSQALGTSTLALQSPSRQPPPKLLTRHPSPPDDTRSTHIHS
ncbi:hypothetical protein DAEQUDRAFT_137899 [Daedalea quercina L-15889]|uniref:Uncharacterized protein n=1 Tax=Daedalea quercina L-15889 TaxID=1314783 RepID=A0A165RSN8_9APHY|nr:hypothetical protein DAEQUDRAFT_137899 [Daedalea quercina L-15889]